MEKICIVKRRKKTNQGMRDPGSWTVDAGESRSLRVPETSSVPINDECTKGGNATGVSKGVFKENETISFGLTSRQGKYFQSDERVRSFINKAPKEVVLDIEENDEGRIMFNFHIGPMNSVKMLKTQHVCQMLQISRSYLINLVKRKKMRSYKIGRLRRFSLEDVLDYITKNEEA